MIGIGLMKLGKITPIKYIIDTDLEVSKYVKDG